MTAILLVVNALVAIGLIILILLQRTDSSAGGAFGGMGSGAQPIIRNPLAKPTAVLAGIFLLSSIAIAYLQQGKSHADSVMQGHEAEVSGTVSPTETLPGPLLASPTAEAGVSTTIDVTPTMEVSPSK
jgi:preprotein translocase subunit SecG